MVVVGLGLWEFLPRIESLSDRYKFLDPFFVSSPGDTFTRIVDMATGRNDSFVVWPYLKTTLAATFGGLVIGLFSGGALGLLLSNSQFLQRVTRPFIVAVNATPRVAFIPIIVILFGPTQGASIAISVLVVFFVAFFNAFEGGSTVASHLLQNARVLGASERGVMLRVRLPYVFAWTMAALPVAIAFSLVSVVTAEILTGNAGIGRLITTATSTVDATLTMAVVAYLSVVGATIVALADVMKRRVLHWWTAGG